MFSSVTISSKSIQKFLPTFFFSSLLYNSYTTILLNAFRLYLIFESDDDIADEDYVLDEEEDRNGLPKRRTSVTPRGTVRTSPLTTITENEVKDRRNTYHDDTSLVLKTNIKMNVEDNEKKIKKFSTNEIKSNRKKKKKRQQIAVVVVKKEEVPFLKLGRGLSLVEKKNDVNINLQKNETQNVCKKKTRNHKIKKNTKYRKQNGISRQEVNASIQAYRIAIVHRQKYLETR